MFVAAMSDEGLTLQTSASLTCYCGKMTIVNFKVTNN